MLVGRESECARLQRLLDSGRSGSASMLVITGEAGVGKTALLDWTCAGAGGMTVLRAIGSDAEAEIPFAALSDLLRPVLDRVASIPRPQADALLGALTLGPAVAGDRFAIYAGVLSVLAAAAEQTPVLIVVDDAGRIDASSAEAMLFAARRLERDRVAVVVAIRVGESSPLQAGDIPELVVQGLELTAAAELLGPDVADSVGAQLYASTGGNPLALVEIPGLLSGAQLSGDEPLPDPLPGGGVEAAFARQLERLDAASRRALLVAALADSGRRGLVDRGCAALGVPEGALEAAAPLAVTVDGVVRFRHPLLRDTVVQLASSSARRAAHRALAAALSGRADADRRAWHLAAAARAPDEEAASALEEAALAARLRGGYGVSAGAFERAARLSPDAADRIRRLHAAAADMQLVGRIDHAVETLDEVVASTPDPMLRADALLQRARADMWRGSPMQAHRALLEQATTIEPVDPGRAAAALIEAAVAAVMTWDVAAARVAAERANAIAPVTDARLSVTAGLMLGHVLVLAGESRRGLDLIGQHGLASDNDDSVTSAAQLAAIAVLPMIWLDRHQRARNELEQLIAEARAVSAASVLPQLLGFQSGLEYRSGRWVAAYAAAGESVQLASETGQRSEVAHGLVCLARIDAAQGRAAECAAHIDNALTMAEEFGIESVRTHCLAIRGSLELAVGRPAAAAEILRQVEARVRAQGTLEPGVLAYAPNLIEALFRSGDLEDAHTALHRFGVLATESVALAPAAAAARCRGLLEPGSQYEAHFVEALRLHEEFSVPFDRARTELCFGERLRRERRIVDSRRHLGAALDGFVRLGAEPWVQRVRVELGASGGQPLRPAAQLLTPAGASDRTQGG